MHNFPYDFGAAIERGVYFDVSRARSSIVPILVLSSKGKLKKDGILSLSFGDIRRWVQGKCWGGVETKDKTKQTDLLPITSRLQATLVRFWDDLNPSPGVIIIPQPLEFWYRQLFVIIPYTRALHMYQSSMDHSISTKSLTWANYTMLSFPQFALLLLALQLHIWYHTLSEGRIAQIEFGYRLQSLSREAFTPHALYFVNYRQCSLSARTSELGC